eukprot:364979-Chlamydomonas_euryale.AAC.4
MVHQTSAAVHAAKVSGFLLKACSGLNLDSVHKVQRLHGHWVSLDKTPDLILHECVWQSLHCPGDVPWHAGHRDRNVLFLAVLPLPSSLLSSS